MKILVACEEWGRVRDALIAAGHEAMSCDLKPTKVPGPHYQGDVRDVLYESWDGLIAHPTCRFLTNAGVRWLHTDPARWEQMCAGADFFNLFLNAKHIPRRAVENPIMHKYAAALIGRRADQFIQPHWFGDAFQKATGFHLEGLPKLIRAHWPKDYPAGTVFEQECWLMGPSAERESLRSRTYPGVARAIAEQWFTA